ncbi:hypothetical protein XENOCAPTIV_007054 [Xenoophorus captivus]|uniref:Uncharacterized protein n=1 Tax=Xenoophorus captivus TaxID=1517983 RepID=A0ABV0QGX5_9TELE
MPAYDATISGSSEQILIQPYLCLCVSTSFSSASCRRLSFSIFCLAVSMLDGDKVKGFLLLFRRKQTEAEDVSIVSGRQHKWVIKAAAHVSQVSILVVVNVQSPVSLHRGEAVVTRLQRVNPDGAGLHAAE